MKHPLLYLAAVSLRNSVVQRLARLRQPKYLLAALAGGAYFYFFFFRHALRGFRAGPVLADPAAPAAWLEPVGALVLLLVLAASWLLGKERAALQFSEAETAFLFPAPVARRTLIHYKLLRAQIPILFSAVLLALVFRRGTVLGGNPLIHAAGWWIVFSTLDLHFMGASFARERLLDRGIDPLRRRLLVVGALGLLAGLAWLGLRQMDFPGGALPTDFRELPGYLAAALRQGPAAWLLEPFAWVVRPYLAADARSFLAALAPALAVMAAHYFWVVRSSVAFEEASLALAEKRARQIEAVRSGDWRGARTSVIRVQSEAFALPGRGWVPWAFLWKSLIELGPVYRWRTWWIAFGGLAALIAWLGADRARTDYLVLVAVFLGMGGLMLAFIAPMFLQRTIQQTLQQIDIIKSRPVAGWQVVAGQLLTPTLLLVLTEVLLVGGALIAAGLFKGKIVLGLGMAVAGVGAVVLILPSLCGLMMMIPYAGVLFFPAWFQHSAGAPAQGIEVMGQRMIFALGYVFTLLVALVPAGGVAAVGFILVNWLAGKLAALAVAAVVAAVILAVELGAAIWLLGERLERFDLSQELPR